MVTQLRVVNDCLAIMGETPLNSLQEEHAFKAAALSRLLSNSERIQINKGAGWWFNAETLKLSANPTDKRVYLPGDAGSVVIPDQSPRVAQRGRVLYNLDSGTDKFENGEVFTVTLIRLLDIELVPISVAEYIAVGTVQQFQNDYDGDQTKTRNLTAAVEDRKTAAVSEHIRNLRVNLLDASSRLSRLRNIIYPARRY